MNDQKILEEEKQTILNCNHDFYDNNPKDKDKNGVAEEDKFCKKCGHHFIKIIQTYREELFNPDKSYKSPVCHICGFHTTVDRFCSEAWLQIPTEEPYNQHGDKLIWVCPDCIAKKANAN